MILEKHTGFRIFNSASEFWKLSEAFKDFSEFEGF